MQFRITLILLAVSTASSAQDSPEPKSKEAFLRVCSSCHKPETVLSVRRTDEQWGETIKKMREKGAKCSEDEFNGAFDYLVAQYGKVNVNRAAAAEIAEILGVSAKDADAIVKYRRQNGKFEDFEALSKTPDVDPKKLEKNRDAISF